MALFPRQLRFPPLAVLALLACQSSRHPSPHSGQLPVTPLLAPTVGPCRATVAPRNAFPVDGGIQVPDPWPLAYSDTLLSPADIDSLRARMSTDATTYLRDGAAFVLGRRAPEDSIPGLASVLPMDNQSAFVRGLAGHPPFRTVHTLPARFGLMLRLPSDAVDVATASERLRVPVDSLDPNTAQRLLASDDIDNQVAGTRLLSTPGIPLPTDLFAGLRPQAFPSLVRSLASRPDVPAETWLTLLGLVTYRVRANPRTWSAPWVSLRDAVPLTDPALQNAVRASVSSLASITGLPLAVLSALRCGDARVLDRIEHSLAHALRCGTGTDHWRSLATAAEVIATQALPPEESTSALVQLVHDAGADVRVLEALAPAAVALPPASARPIVEALALSRDPGVLAALLEQLALHVQHARALPLGVRMGLLILQPDFSTGAPWR